MPKQKREIPVSDSVGAAVSGVVGAGVGPAVDAMFSVPSSFSLKSYGNFRADVLKIN